MFNAGEVAPWTIFHGSTSQLILNLQPKVDQNIGRSLNACLGIFYSVYCDKFYQSPLCGEDTTFGRKATELARDTVP